MGCEGWGYDDVLPYFKRAEDNERGEDDFHGVGGPLAVSRQPLDAPARGRDGRGGRAGRPRAQPRPQRRAPGGRRALPADAARRPALQRGGGVPPPGGGAAEPRGETGALRRSGSSSRATARSASRSSATASVETVRAEREVIVSRRRLPVAGAADALGHRARPRTSSRWGSTCARTCPSAGTSRTTAWRRLNYLTDEPTLFDRDDAGEHRAARERGARRRSRRTSPRPGASSGRGQASPAPDIQFHFAPSLFFDEGLTRAGRPRLLLRPGDRQADEPRPRDAAGAAARLEAARPLQLPHDRGGPAEHDRRAAARARDLVAARHEGGRARAVQRARRPTRTRTSSTSRSGPARPSTTRPRPARWAPSSTPSCGCYGVEGLRVVDASVMPTITRGNTQRPDRDDRREGRRPDRDRSPVAAAAEQRSVSQDERSGSDRHDRTGRRAGTCSTSSNGPGRSTAAAGSTARGRSRASSPPRARCSARPASAIPTTIARAAESAKEAQRRVGGDAVLRARRVVRRAAELLERHRGDRRLARARDRLDPRQGRRRDHARRSVSSTWPRRSSRSRSGLVLPSMTPGRDQHRAAGPDRRRRRDHAVELPARAGDALGRAGARARERGRAQGRPQHADHRRRRDRPRVRGGRPAGRRPARDPRRRRGRHRRSSRTRTCG